MFKLRKVMEVERARILLVRAYLRSDRNLTLERAHEYADYDLKKG